MSLKTTIREWFRTGLKPSESQFFSFFDSIRWNDEKVPLTDIEGIDEIIADKADKEALDNHLIDAAAHADLFETVNQNITNLETNKADATSLDNHLIDEAAHADLFASKLSRVDLSYTNTSDTLTIANSAGASITLPNATTSKAGVMSAYSKQKVTDFANIEAFIEKTTNKSTNVATDITSSTKYPSVAAIVSWVNSFFQKILVSGSTIKTINGNSILGSGDLSVEPVDYDIVTGLIESNFESLFPKGATQYVSNSSVVDINFDWRAISCLIVGPSNQNTDNYDYSNTAPIKITLPTISNNRQNLIIYNDSRTKIDIYYGSYVYYTMQVQETCRISAFNNSYYMVVPFSSQKATVYPGFNYGELSKATLQYVYPNSPIGFRVHSNAAGQVIYEKTSSGWVKLYPTLVS